MSVEPCHSTTQYNGGKKEVVLGNNEDDWCLIGHSCSKPERAVSTAYTAYTAYTGTAALSIVTTVQQIAVQCMALQHFGLNSI